MQKGCFNIHLFIRKGESVCDGQRTTHGNQLSFYHMGGARKGREYNMSQCGKPGAALR